MTQEVSSSNIGYVSLHNHTTSSIQDSLITPKELFKRTKELGQTAVAITDHGSLGAVWDCYNIAKSTGVKLIVGCECYFVNDVSNTTEKLSHIILIAKNHIGYKNLLKIQYKGFQNSVIMFKRVYPRIDWKILEEHSEGLICTTACANGIIGQLISGKQIDEAKTTAKRLQSIFKDDFAIELQATYLKRSNSNYSVEVDQHSINIQLKEIAREFGIKPIVTTNAHYVNKQQAEAHDCLLAMGSGQPVSSNSRLKYCSNDGVLPEFYIKSEEEILKTLKRQFRNDPDFVRECVENTKHFADLCEQPDWVDLKYTNPSGKELPEFDVKSQPDYNEFLEWKNTCDKDLPDDSLYLRFKTFEGYYKYLQTDKGKNIDQKVYVDRLEHELNVLHKCGVSSYMLIVADYVCWCRDNDVPVGPGRGSCSGSLVGYFTRIHDANSITYGLVFERFHNLLKTSYSDIDADFSKFDRHRVIEYIKQKYGEDKVAGISNFNTLTPKVYARSISRAYNYGNDRKKAVQIGNTLAGAIPDDIKSVKKAIEEAALFREYSKPAEDGGGGYLELAKFAEDLDRVPIAVSTHAAGLVIGSRPLTDIVPLRRDKEGQVSLEYEKERTEEVGLVKMDILGLSTLDIIKSTYDLIKSSGKELLPFDVEAYDKEAYDLISSGNLYGVFQFGTSAGTIELCKRYKATSIEDLAIITTLARPGSAEIRSDYFEVKEGNKPIELLHPSLDNALRPTLGFALFDESLLILSKDVAGWDYGDADVLRKLTKMKGKDPSKAEKIKNKFINDSVSNGVQLKDAEEIWEKVVEPFQKYSFNKAHAVAYSMISYHTAWLKAHYPLEFLVANLMLEVNSNSKDAKDNVAKIKEEIRALNVKIIPPDINNSDVTYKIIDQNTLMTGFEAIKGMSKNAIPEIISKRPFTSFEDLMLKMDAKNCNVTSLRALSATGCLDSFGLNRKQMFFYAADYKKKLGQHQKKKKVTGPFVYPWPDEKEWTVAEKSALERHYVGESLVNDKVQEYSGFFTYNAMPYSKLKPIFPPPPDDLSDNDKRKYVKDITFLQGEVKSFFEFKIKKETSKYKGQLMCKIMLEDFNGNRINVTCFPDNWQKLKDQALKLSKGKFKFDVGCGVYINGKLNWYNGELNVSFEDLVRFSPPPQLPEDLAHRKVSLKAEKIVEELVEPVDRNELLEDIEQELIDTGSYDDLEPELD